MCNFATITIIVFTLNYSLNVHTYEKNRMTNPHNEHTNLHDKKKGNV